MTMRMLREAAGVLWPRACAGCGAPDEGVCRACRALVAGTQRGEVGGEACGEAGGEAGGVAGGVPMLWAATYDGAVRAMVLACKEEGRGAATRALAAVLARLVADASQAASDVCVVLVPSSRAGWRRRGFAPVRMLARRAGLRGVELVARDEEQQKHRRRAERLQRGTFAVRDPGALVGRHCIVVDDVVTSGATAGEAARAVRAAGAASVVVVALARVPRHG